MVLWLRALTALPENPGSLPSTYMAAPRCLELQFQEVEHPFPTPSGTGYTCGAEIHAGLYTLFKKKKKR